MGGIAADSYSLVQQQCLSFGVNGTLDLIGESVALDRT